MAFSSSYIGVTGSRYCSLGLGGVGEKLDFFGEAWYRWERNCNFFLSLLLADCLNILLKVVSYGE